MQSASCEGPRHVLPNTHRPWGIWCCCPKMCPYIYAYRCELQQCLTLGDPMDCSPPGSSVHGILQAGVLERVCHALLQGVFLTPGQSPRLSRLLQVPLEAPGKQL